ncbi:bifunctional 3-(3-hydroxy-phenyl)propionate/3-hydroxycinnamic acid hydroxylase [Rhizorhabdus wittichii]|uniref:bifunctional 3-(3-hydroxy-phenyl)propionate/3-hydroxycinnamic acid hydroxylase n=1 Tax=Rhizorhabdus wittichii TaxID=160791 RepID=UPI00055C4235
MGLAVYDVIVVGMGPVGAVTACLLGRAGLRVAVIEREMAIFDKPRAIVLDHEALRVLQACGVAADFFDTLAPHTGTDFLGVDGQLIKLFDPKPPPFELGWPPNMMFIQPYLEAALDDAMAKYPNVERRRGWTVTAIDQDEQGVRVEAATAEGRRTIEARWIVGADGANSTVRRAAGIGVDDLDFKEWWIVVDAWLTGPADLPRKTTQYCWPDRPATFVVGPQNLRRWEIKLLPDDDLEALQDEGAIREILRRYVDVTACSIWRSAVYRFRAAVATRWRSRRMFLAGDAAHTMPPFLAQGLCAGLRDAANIAWKLEQVERHGTAASLLDSYEIERKPHVTEIVRHAKAFGLIIGELDRERALARDTVLAEQLRTGAVSTERQAFIPPLHQGFLENGCPSAGQVFVQPRILRDGREHLMDDVIGPSFAVFANAEALDALDASLVREWLRIGGTLLLSGDECEEAPIETLDESDGRVAGWLERESKAAVIVRPDRYVYGAADDGRALATMMADLLRQLAPDRMVTAGDIA